MITLVKDTIDNNDIDRLIDWLKTYPRLTKGPLTLELEEKWSKWLGKKYSVFCNSGSSANLLMLSVLQQAGYLKNNKVVVPSVAWSTDLAPVLQLGLKPLLCDSNLDDLSVDEAIDQVLGVGFDVEYSLKNENGFILKPYIGLAFNKTLSGKVKMNDINGAGLKEDISQDNTMNGAVAKKIGFSLTKNTEDIGISLNFEHSNMDKIINNNLNLSISKKLQRVAKKRAMQRKQDEKLDPELESLFDQLQVVRENERLALVANKLNQENQAMKELIIQLIKENQKFKTENKLLIKNMN